MVRDVGVIKVGEVYKSDLDSMYRFDFQVEGGRFARSREYLFEGNADFRRREVDWKKRTGDLPWKFVDVPQWE